MTSLIDEVLRDAASTGVPVSTLLRKALIVAKKLDVPDVPQWIEKELSGYTGFDVLPPHRIVHRTVKAKGMRGWVLVQFPTNGLEETISRQEVRQSVAQIEGLVRSDGNIVYRYSAEAMSALQHLMRDSVDEIARRSRERRKHRVRPGAFDKKNRQFLAKPGGRLVL